MDLLRRALKNDVTVTLDVAALDLAQVEYPGLLPGPYLVRLDEMAETIAHRLAPGDDGIAFLRTANQYLFEEQGFGADEVDYSHPRNSCLNSVLETKCGLPITLSLLYMEIARRLDKSVLGIGVPGHFVVEYRDDEFSFYIDPINRGRFITGYDCEQMSLAHANIDIANVPRALEPVTRSALLTRMLNNMLSVYLDKRETAKSVQVLDLLVEAHPREPQYYRARAAVRLRRKEYRLANFDLQSSLMRSSDAVDPRARAVPN
jgi:regulator of sirC expression with transglutaminase-like and TPR domain